MLIFRSMGFNSHLTGRILHCPSAEMNCFNTDPGPALKVSANTATPLRWIELPVPPSLRLLATPQL